jgi:hypothetical protein
VLAAQYATSRRGLTPTESAVVKDLC